MARAYLYMEISEYPPPRPRWGQMHCENKCNFTILVATEHFKHLSLVLV